MKSQCSSRWAAADRRPLDRRDERLVEVDQRFHQPSLWRFFGARRVFQEIIDIDTRAE
jgi:hypothetical protein